MNRKNMHCGICSNAFSDDDEIVYCPDCGTPMHRECWDENKVCPNQEKHSDGYEWAEAKESSKTADKPYSDAFVCDICGKELVKGDEIAVCPDCGTPVHRACWEEKRKCPNEDKHVDDYDWNKAHRPKYAPPTGQQTMTISSIEEFSEMIENNPIKSSETGEELTCGGVKQKELLHFLGTGRLSTPRLFMSFMNMANSKRKVSINVFSGFFFPIYFFYRRMTGPGIIGSLLMLVLFPVMLDYEAFFSSAVPGEGTLALASYSYGMLPLIYLIQLIAILFTDYFYMKWSVRKILTIRESCKELDEREYHEVLESKGSPRLINGIAGVLFFCALIYCIGLLI